MNYSISEPTDSEPLHKRVKFEQACFKCGSHYCLMDCEEKTNYQPRHAIPPETAKSPARPWVGLTDKELEAAFYHVEYDTTFSYQKEPDKWCKAFYQYVDRLLEEKNS